MTWTAILGPCPCRGCEQPVAWTSFSLADEPSLDDVFWSVWCDVGTTRPHECIRTEVLVGLAEVAA